MVVVIVGEVLASVEEMLADRVQTHVVHAGGVVAQRPEGGDVLASSGVP